MGAARVPHVQLMTCPKHHVTFLIPRALLGTRSQWSTVHSKRSSSGPRLASPTASLPRGSPPPSLFSYLSSQPPHSGGSPSLPATTFSPLLCTDPKHAYPSKATASLASLMMPALRTQAHRCSTPLLPGPHVSSRHTAAYLLTS